MHRRNYRNFDKNLDIIAQFGEIQKFEEIQKNSKNRLYVASTIVTVVRILIDQTSEYMIRQNLFPTGAMIWFGCAVRVATTFLSSDFFLRCRTSCLLPFLLSRASREVLYNPLEICSGEVKMIRERKRNITTKLGEHQEVQKFSISLLRGRHLSTMRKLYNENSLLANSPLLFYLFFFYHIYNALHMSYSENYREFRCREFSAFPSYLKLRSL